MFIYWAVGEIITDAQWAKLLETWQKKKKFEQHTCVHMLGDIVHLLKERPLGRVFLGKPSSKRATEVW